MGTNGALSAMGCCQDRARPAAAVGTTVLAAWERGVHQCQYPKHVWSRMVQGGTLGGRAPKGDLLYGATS